MPLLTQDELISFRSHEKTKQSVWDMPETYKAALEYGKEMAETQAAANKPAAYVTHLVFFSLWTPSICDLANKRKC